MARRNNARRRRSRVQVEHLESRQLLSTLPDGFAEFEIASGLASPTTMQFAPDGQIFVAEQTGNIRAIDQEGVLSPTPVLTLDTDARGERGLIGFTFNPNDFDHSHEHGDSNEYHLYVHYTTAVEPVHNRVSRFLMRDGAVVPDSEEVLLNLEPLGALGHNGGEVVFGSDGKLYIGVGDNWHADRAQHLDSRFGKVLRINPDGSIPEDNPFYHQTTGDNRAIWALGLRNPYRIHANPLTDDLYINDVSLAAYEELNLGIPGANYGWPIVQGAAEDLRFVDPLYKYPHFFIGQPDDLIGCAIVGSAVYAPENMQFPGEYHGDIFIADYCSGIRRYDLETGEAEPFSTAMPFIVDIRVGPDGSLYYLTHGESHVDTPTPNSGGLFRIDFTGSKAAAISRHPADAFVAVDSPAIFEVTATGSPPYTYQWQRDGVDIPGATQRTFTLPAATLEDDGAQFRVLVTNEHGEALSNAATLTVSPFPPPTASITAPADDLFYRAGDTISYASGSIAGDGSLIEAENHIWWVHFHHDDHFHPFLPPTSGKAEGTFSVPISGETDNNVWFRIYLQVTDQYGLISETHLDVHPVKSQVQLRTSPEGLEINLDSQPIGTPHDFIGVVGVSRILEAPPTQLLEGQEWVFDSWSDGSAARHTIATPETDATYTAIYRLGEAGEGSGLLGHYYNNPTLSGTPIIQLDPTVSFNWHASMPLEGIDSEAFSVRWEGQILPLFSDTHHFYVRADEGVRLWIDGQLIIDDWVEPQVGTDRVSLPIFLEAGQAYEIILEVYDLGGHASTKLFWSNSMMAKSIIPRSQLVPLWVPDQPPEEGGPSVSHSILGDFDGDGEADHAFIFPSTEIPGAWHWHIRLSGGGVIDQAFGMVELDVPILGDFDGDGKTDLAVFRSESDLIEGAAHWFAILSDGGVIDQAFGMAGMDVPVPADYDGDGKTDLAVYRPSSDLVEGHAHWFVLLSDGGVIDQAFGQADLDQPVPADYNGDNRANLAVYRPQSHQIEGAAHWLVLLPDGTVLDRAFGMAWEDVPIPADFDGDGRVDFATYRPSTSEFFLLGSLEGGRYVPFGAPGDLPLVGHFDEDDQADLGVYRPSTDEVLLLLSARGEFSLELGLEGVGEPLMSPLARRRMPGENSNA